MSKKDQETKPGAVTFSKRQFLKAANFTRVERDVLAAILENGKHYTLDEVQKLLKDFKARRAQ